jgi:hypothetical protein
MNVILRICGDDIKLAGKDDVKHSRNFSEVLKYHYSFLSIKELLGLLWLRMTRKV